MGFSYSYDIARYRFGETRLYTADKPTALSRGDLARTLFSMAAPLDQYFFGPALFDFGERKQLKIPNGITVAGSGWDETRLKNYVWSDKDQTGFSLNNCILRDLTFEVSGPVNEDARTIGFDVAGPWTCKLTRVRMIGNAWCWFDWQPEERINVFFDGCEFFSGRQCVSVMASGGMAGWYEFHGCRFFVDGSKAQDHGATSDAVYGIGCAAMLRGGVHKFVNCDATLLGAVPPAAALSYLPRLAFISDTFNDGPAPNTNISVLGASVTRENRGVPEAGCYDFDIRNAHVRAALRFGNVIGTGPGNLPKFYP